MSNQESLIKLIEKAAAVVGNETELARALGTAQPNVSAWKAGTRTCTPADRARLAGFAREDPVKELVSATIETAKGTKREQLEAIFNAWLEQPEETPQGKPKPLALKAAPPVTTRRGGIYESVKGVTFLNRGAMLVNGM